MSKIDLIVMSFRNLWRRKLRTALTVLGVVIGAASIIIMISLGLGMKVQQEKIISDSGSIKEIFVFPKETSDTNKKVKLNNDSLKKVKNINHVKSAYPALTLSARAIIELGKYTGRSNVIGIDPKYFGDAEVEILQGKPYEKNQKLTFLLASSYKNRLKYNGDQITNEESKTINPFTSKIILNLLDEEKKLDINLAGIYKSSSFDRNPNTYMDINEVKRLNKMYSENYKVDEYTNFNVLVDDVKYVEEVQKELDKLNFNNFSMVEFANSFSSSMSVVQAVLAGIGSISLLVAAIGITNTMVMSIYERTKEIGVMKVIGASVSDIRELFLIESAMIGLLGGIVGVALSYGISNILNTVLASSFRTRDAFDVSVIPLWLVALSLVFSILIGLISGYMPARRATKLSAIDAIRTN